MTIDPNDPRLTAFVLGELDPSERAAVEAMLDRSRRLPPGRRGDPPDGRVAHRAASRGEPRPLAVPRR